MWSYRTGAGGGNFGRMFHKHDTVLADINEGIYNDEAANGYVFQRKWTTTRGEWRWPRPSTGVWSCVGLSYDGGSAGNIPIAYRDGVSQTVTTVASPVGTLATSTDAYAIGNRISDNTRCWDGRLCEFAKWDVLLNANEHLALSKGVSPLRVRTESLVIYIPLWGTHSPEIDIGPNHSTGTVTGTTIAVGPPVTLFTPKNFSVEQVVTAAFNPAWAERSNHLIGDGFVY